MPKLVSTSLDEGAKVVFLNAFFILNYDTTVFAGSGVITLRDVVTGVIRVEAVANNPNVLFAGTSVYVDFEGDVTFGSRFSLDLPASMVKDSAGKFSDAVSILCATEPLSAPVIFTGTEGADEVNGGNADDVLDGFGGRDMLRGGYGNDTVRGGNDDDYVIGHEGDDFLLGEDGFDRIFGGPGDDILDGGEGDDYLEDTEGRNTLLGGAGDDYFFSAEPNASGSADGGPGNDAFTVNNHVAVNGGEGDDSIEVRMLTGEASNVDGGSGSDTIRIKGMGLQQGKITVTGGTGNDTFAPAFSYSKNAVIVVNDFDIAGGDQIDLNALPTRDGGFVQLRQSGSNTTIVYNDAQLSGISIHTVGILLNVQADALKAQQFRDGKLPLVGVAAIKGSANADLLRGGDGNDTLDTLAGNDHLYGNGGDDFLSGGTGVDTAHYAGNLRDYVFEKTGGFTVRALAGGEGSDVLLNIERLVFADTAMAKDTGADGIAGKVYRIYNAAFDRAPDAGGLGYWIAMTDQGATMASVSRNFVQSAEFKNLYASSKTNDDLVHRFYENVLDRAPDAAGKSYWVKLLDQGTMDVPGVLAAISESAENVSNTAKLIGEGFTYVPFV